jgi:hypothetical protein
VLFHPGVDGRLALHSAVKSQQLSFHRGSLSFSWSKIGEQLSPIWLPRTKINSLWIERGTFFWVAGLRVSVPPWWVLAFALSLSSMSRDARDLGRNYFPHQILTFFHPRIFFTNCLQVSNAQSHPLQLEILTSSHLRTFLF